MRTSLAILVSALAMTTDGSSGEAGGSESSNQNEGRALYGDPLPPAAVARLGTIRFRHDQSPYSQAFAADGRRLAWGTSLIQVLDVTTGKQLRTLARQDKDGVVDSLAFSPQDDLLAAGSRTQMIELWDLATGKCLRKMQVPKVEGSFEIATLSFSPDGRTLASAGPGTAVRLWDVATGKYLRALEGHTAKVYAVAFSPDGLTLVSGSEDRTARLWDTQSGKEIRTLSAPAGHCGNCVSAVAFSPRGKTLATGGCNQGVVCLWDLATGTTLHRLEAHEERTMAWISSVAFSPDGATLASGDGVAGSGDGDVVRVWDVAGGKPLHEFSGHEGKVSVAFLPNGKTLASSGKDSTIRLWDVGTGKEMPGPAAHEGRVFSVGFSRDGRSVVSGSEDGSFRVWDAMTGKQLRSIGGRKGLVEAQFSPDGKRLIAYDLLGNTIGFWDVVTGEKIVKSSLYEPGVSCVAIAGDGKKLASGTKNGAIHIWDTANGRLLRELKGHRDEVSSMAFSPDGKTLASGSQDGTIRVWDVATGRQLRIVNDKDALGISVVFSPNGRMLASTCENCTVIRLVDPASGKQIAELEQDENGVVPMAFSPNSKILAAGGAPLELWEVPAGKRLFKLEQDEEVMSVAYSPDGQYLATGRGDTTVLVWDLSRLGETPAALSVAASSSQGAARAATQSWAIVLYGAGQTPKDAQAAIDRYHPQEFPEIKLAPRFPLVEASERVAGMRPGYHIALLGYCDGETEAKMVRDLVSRRFSGVYVKKVEGSYSASCPAITTTKGHAPMQCWNAKEPFAFDLDELAKQSAWAKLSKADREALSRRAKINQEDSGQLQQLGEKYAVAWTRCARGKCGLYAGVARLLGSRPRFDAKVRLDTGDKMSGGYQVSVDTTALFDMDQDGRQEFLVGYSITSPVEPGTGSSWKSYLSVLSLPLLKEKLGIEFGAGGEASIHVGCDVTMTLLDRACTGHPQLLVSSTCQEQYCSQYYDEDGRVTANPVPKECAPPTHKKTTYVYDAQGDRYVKE